MVCRATPLGHTFGERNDKEKTIPVPTSLVQDETAFYKLWVGELLCWNHRKAEGGRHNSLYLSEPVGSELGRDPMDQPSGASVSGASDIKCP